MEGDKAIFGRRQYQLERPEGSVELPRSGPNFAAYSTLAAAIGRTHVHSVVADTVVSAYSALAAKHPAKTFVYGETGWPSGGRFRPHRTHQNGLSVDFFVPVRNGDGKSVPLPTAITNRFGYDIEFANDAKYGQYEIDFPAMAEHLYAQQNLPFMKGQPWVRHDDHSHIDFAVPCKPITG